MERVDLTKKDFETMRLISATTSLVCDKDGKMYKVFNPIKTDIDNMQEKIMLGDKLNLYHIERPEELIYMHNKFIGYTSKKFEGITLFTYLYDFLEYGKSYNIDLLAFIFKDLEDIVARANKEGIVMPDLGGLNNFFVTKNGLRYIDFGGLQIGDKRTEDYSSLLVGKNWLELFDNPKYYNKDYLFTSELDKKSLIYLFFSIAFKIKLKLVKDLHKKEIIVNLFKEHNINDGKLMYKVWLLSQEDHPNEFIADDIRRIAKDYKIVTNIKEGKRVLVRR